MDIASKSCKVRSKHAETTSERAMSQGQLLKTQRTYLCDAWQVDYNRLMDELNLLQGLLKPRLKQVPELHLLLIMKDESGLS